MADINLKTETPDTSLPSTGFLFGADSQSAASPSVYSTQTVATALLGSSSLTGATVTADAPVLNLTQTWNNSGVTFTALKFNVPTDSSAAGSLLMDLQVGGSSKFNVNKDGLVRASPGLRSAVAFGSTDRSNTGMYFADTGLTIRFSLSGSVPVVIDSTRFVLAADIGFASSSLNASYTVDTFITRRAAANLRLGAADAAAPVAQTLSVQSVVAGTTNTAGANLTITGSQGTGTGAGGSIVFQVAPAGSSGTAQNALATALTISSAGNVSIGNAAIATTATDGFLYVPSCAGTPTGTPTTVTGRAPIVVDTTNNKLYFYSGAAWRDAGP